MGTERLSIIRTGEVMSIQEVSNKPLALIVTLAALLMLAVLCVARTTASASGGTSALGTFTWGATQTGRLMVSTPTTGQWSSGRQAQVVLGFDVFRPSMDISGGQTSGSCVKHHMIERQACQVTLSPGEAASFDVNGDGISSFQPVIMTGDGNVKDLMITLEVLEAGKIVTAVAIPAAQKSQADH
jgi:hypothetical protein